MSWHSLPLFVAFIVLGEVVTGTVLYSTILHVDTATDAKLHISFIVTVDHIHTIHSRSTGY